MFLSQKFDLDYEVYVILLIMNFLILNLINLIFLNIFNLSNIQFFSLISLIFIFMYNGKEEKVFHTFFIYFIRYIFLFWK